MSVRPATINDALHCATLGKKFIEAAGMPDATIEQCVKLCSAMIGNPDCGVFVSSNGVIAGVIAPLYYNPEYKQAVELWWWSEDGRGIELLNAFEGWAKEMGANDINMSTLDHFTNTAIDVLLSRKGYTARDKTHRKALK